MTSLKGLEKDLTKLQKDLDKQIIKTIKQIGKTNYKELKIKYNMENLQKHTSNIELIAYKGDFKNGFILSSGDDEIAVYNEFGTGIVGEGTNKMAASAGYKYNVPSLEKGAVPEGAIYQYLSKNLTGKSTDDYMNAYEATKDYLESITTTDTWWFFKPGYGWCHTEGMKGKNIYSTQLEKIKKAAPQDFETSIGQCIGNYKSTYK